MKIFTILKNIVAAIKNTAAQSDANLQTAKDYSKDYTDGFFFHEIGTSSLSLTAESTCGYLVIVPIGSGANVYFVNEYEGSCYSKTLLNPLSGVSVSINGLVWTVTTTGSMIEYYAIKIVG